MAGRSLQPGDASDGPHYLQLPPRKQSHPKEDYQHYQKLSAFNTNKYASHHLQRPEEAYQRWPSNYQMVPSLQRAVAACSASAQEPPASTKPSLPARQKPSPRARQSSEYLHPPPVRTQYQDKIIEPIRKVEEVHNEYLTSSQSTEFSCRVSTISETKSYSSYTNEHPPPSPHSLSPSPCGPHSPSPSPYGPHSPSP